MNIIIDLLWKFLLGGTIVATATYLSSTGRTILSGLAILFPGITITSFLIIGYEGGTEQIRAVLPYSVIAAVGFAVLLGVLYISSFYVSPTKAVALSFCAWLIVTGTITILIQ